MWILELKGLSVITVGSFLEKWLKQLSLPSVYNGQ